ncbi:chemotaxis protein CheW [Erythrobacter sp. WG]|uniref:chemotaxis protein CheW n=1 Tax=Erythrobacter sp. WG TaxID=2985510 RepID=UPI00226D7085|nr:chemotaxis protein CheW [Erythrobacter sp. WG]MCX9147361.1 chemotaxis protein CheW [Erythrobacter sp. WG]
MKHTRIVPDTAAGEVTPPVDTSAEAVSPARQRQFTVFTVAGEIFGVALQEVKEIIRMPEVVRVPLAPPSLEGLANLRGTVLPVVAARSLFGSEPAAPDDATRVVVLDHAQPIGIVVDRVISVIAVDAARIEDGEEAEKTIRSDLLQGVIKDEGALGLVMVLDSARLIEQEYAALAGSGPTTHDGFAAHDTGVATLRSACDTGADIASDPEIQLVSFEVAGQEYALPIQSVREIVQCPERITAVPKAAASVVGLIALRDRLLPVVSLRGLFGLPEGTACEQDRVAVVSVGEGLLVGLLLDKVNEVLRVRQSGIDAVPAMLAADRNLAEITAICRLDGGRRLVSILSAEAMFDQPAIAHALESAQDHLARRNVPMTGPANRTAAETRRQEQFVVFRLESEEFGVNIAAVQEIVRVPDDLARVPRTENCIRGVMNLRGEVIPLVDQRARFGLPPCEDHDRQRIVVFTMDGVQTGFIVDSVAEVMRIDHRFIKPAPETTDANRRMIRRVANLTEARRMILLLDTEKLLAIDPVAAAA